MKRLVILAAALVCAACSPVVVKINPSDVANAKLVSVRDMRPSSEREQKIFSLLITSKEYGIIRVGDGKFTPPPITLLQDQVYKKFHANGHVPQVTVYHFVIYTNDSVGLRRGATAAVCGAGCGLISGLLINQSGGREVPDQAGLVDEKAFDGLLNDEYRRGLYSPDEDTLGLGGVYIVYIETAIDGEKVFTRTVVPFAKGVGREGLPKAAERAIESHLGHYDELAESPSAPVSKASWIAPSAQSHSNASTIDPAISTAAPMAQAQAVANQMGCGAVQPGSHSTFIAACGSYAVLISCDGGQCRPLHTLRSNDSQGGKGDVAN